MYNFQSRMRLLSLISILFIYFAISRLISSDLQGFYIWLIVTIVYLTSLVIFYVTYKKTQKNTVS